MRAIRLTIVLAVLLLAWLNIPAAAASYKVIGHVVDSVNHEPVPYASIAVVGGTNRALADANGGFTITVNSLPSRLRITAMGFKDDTASVRYSQRNNLIVPLMPVGVAVGEVVVRPKREKYSKKNNPAVELSRRIAANRERNDPRSLPFFNRKKYEKYAIGFNEFRPDNDKNMLLKKFGFLRDYVDTSDVTGKPVLIFSLRELNYDNHYRKEPRKDVSTLTARSIVGVDDFLDQENLRVFLDDILGDIDIFRNDVVLLQNRFVSPFSPLAPDFYRFYITDTVDIDEKPHIELSFVPRNSLSFGFTGKIYVEKDDPRTFVRKVLMNVPKDINLNFVDRIYITQEYARGADSTVVKTSENVTAEIKVMPGTPALYASKRSVIHDINFNEPSEEETDSIFNRIGSNFVSAQADARGPVYWLMNRPTPLTDKEYRMEDMMSQLRRNPLFYWVDKIVRIAFTGYIATAKESKIDIGPMNTIVSHNDVEGFRLRAGGMTTANLLPHLFTRGYVAYGTKDKRWKYRTELEWSFNDRKYHAREFPIHSLRAAYQYDVDMIGQHYLFTNPDNMFLSFKRQKDFQMTYLRKATLDYTLELMNNFSVEAGMAWNRQYATELMPFKIVGGRNYPFYDETFFRLQLRYAPGEKFYQSKTHRYPISLDAPVVCISHLYAPKGAFGNLFGINRTELSFQKRFWMSAFGYLDFMIKGGHIWGSAPYPNLLIPNANLSYTIQPESYSLMNAMEFINDSYASVDLTYWANGAILNYVPWLKKLKLREVFSFKGLWGHLSHRNDPLRNDGVMAFPEISNTQRLTNRPYMEASVGIENIFKVLRVDYVWRLTYRDNPGIDRSGVRIALHVTF